MGDERRYAGLMGWVRWLYDWVLSWASSPYGLAALAVLSFCESSFFPIPPDPLLIALCLGARHRALWFAMVCTVASVLGGGMGYWIGSVALDTVGMPILEFYGKEGGFAELAERFRDVGNGAVLVAAITPVPYKLVTITAGAMSMDLVPFIGASILGRGLRFFAVAGLIYWKGETIAGFIEAHFERLMVLFAVLLVGGIAAVRLIL